MKNLIKISMCVCERERVKSEREGEAAGQPGNDHSGASELSTNCPNMFGLVWFCCRCALEKRNETQMERKNAAWQHGAGLPPNAMMSEKLTCM